MNFLPLAFIFAFYLPQVLPKSKNVQEIHADQETIGKISAADQPAVDILFLLDGSNSIGSSSFNDSKHFAGKLCDALDIDPDRVHVGLIQFTSTPHIEFPLDSYQNKQEVEEGIQNTTFRGGRKNIKQALECILCEGFPGGRNSTVPEILFIISNGKSSKSTTTLATQLKERGITIFTVGIKSRRLERLRMLASKPTEQHMFSVEDADGAINGLYSALTGSIYNATAPDPCNSQPCQNGGTCVPEGLDKYHCLCPVGYGGDIHCVRCCSGLAYVHHPLAVPASPPKLTGLRCGQRGCSRPALCGYRCEMAGQALAGDSGV